MTITSEQLLKHLYYNKLPQVYRDMDDKLKTRPLYRYLSSLIEGGYSEVIKDINNLLDLVDPEKCPEEFLPYLCRSFGLEYFEDIDPIYQRRFLLNIGEIIKRRGTHSCIRFLVRVLTGLDVELQYIRGEFEGNNGRHLIVTLLAETLEQVVNIDTSVFVVERYLQTQLPYYIYPHVSSRVATQKVQTVVYRKNALTTHTAYDLVSGSSSGSIPSTIYGVRIDLTNSNPETAVTYTYDAVGMTGGATAWDSMAIFKDIKPCVLKNGIVQYYLNPNDFTKKADGTPADIESGNDGDVMIEIPKTGFSITTNGNYIDVKVTNDQNNPNFKYYAHTREMEGDRDKLYIGAYLGWKDGNNKLRSLSGKAPTRNQTIGTFRTQAQANGNGYDLVSFYPLTLLQCLYLIKYKNLDSQTALGRGYVDRNSAATNTGGTNQKGMFFGETTGKQQMKFLGIEDFWGNLRWWIDGLYSDANRNIKTAFQNFNDTGSGYTDRGQGTTSSIGNYMSKPQGTSEAGFIAKEVSGSSTTYFADYAYLYADRLPTFGGHRSNTYLAGAFSLNVFYIDWDSDSYSGGRLMYL